MKKLNLKQKKIIAIILIILAVIAYYYIYINDTVNETSNQDLEINNTQENEEINEVEEKTNKKIIVHICGAVNIEGIVELEEGSRISNAIEKAGGIKENAELADINLAYPLEDGMKIYIPTKEEAELNKKENIQINNYVTSSSGGINLQESESNTQSKSTTPTSKEKVNINTATKEELDTLPGIGPSIALKIIEYREQNGKFNSIEEIKEVSGIGDAKYENIKDLIGI